MQIVIEILEEEYEKIKSMYIHNNATAADLRRIIANGTPLSKGKWTSTTLGGYTCSNCNKEFTYPRFIGRALYYYCPNCGAKMEVEDEDSNN